MLYEHWFRTTKQNCGLSTVTSTSMLVAFILEAKVYTTLDVRVTDTMFSTQSQSDHVSSLSWATGFRKKRWMTF